jgi:hypothetical protein
MEREVRWARHEIAHLLERTELSGLGCLWRRSACLAASSGPQLPHRDVSVQ